MNRDEKIKLLEICKKSHSLDITQGVSIILIYLSVVTSIVASTIISFRNNFVTTFMLIFYILLSMVVLTKPIIDIYAFRTKIRKIDKLIYNIIVNKPIDEAIIENLVSKI